jgi:hypothetical protein
MMICFARTQSPFDAVTFLTIAMTAPGPERPPSFRGLLSAVDPKAPDGVFKCCGSLLILKLPFSGN